VAVFLTRRDPRITAALLVAFAAVAVVTTLIAARPNPPSLVNLLNRHLESSAQLPVRVSLLLVVLLVLLAETLGLDVLLGAFSAGIVMRLVASGSEPDVIKGKLEAIGFGFLIPVFFVVSGITFDLHVFLHDPASLWRVVFFVGLLLLSRGAPVLLLYRKEITRAERLPLVFFSATGLPLIVVITGIATAAGRIAPVNAASLVAAGMLSLMVFPAAGLQGLRRAGVERSGGKADTGRSRATATRRSSRRRSKGTT
ncbi:MAG: cation:proton antiporter domain-containing protein, partial [Acidimicrobiales bacterium]